MHPSETRVSMWTHRCRQQIHMYTAVTLMLALCENASHLIKNRLRFTGLGCPVHCQQSFTLGGWHLKASLDSYVLPLYLAARQVRTLRGTPGRAICEDAFHCKHCFLPEPLLSLASYPSLQGRTLKGCHASRHNMHSLSYYFDAFYHLVIFLLLFIHHMTHVLVENLSLRMPNDVRSKHHTALQHSYLEQ